jgi:hypothetical protein
VCGHVIWKGSWIMRGIGGREMGRERGFGGGVLVQLFFSLILYLLGGKFLFGILVLVSERIEKLDVFLVVTSWRLRLRL